MDETAIDQAKARPAVAPPLLPCVLAWLFPGLGHFCLKRRARGAILGAVVLATFGLGLASDGAASLIDPRQPLTFLATFDNIALGPLDLVSRYLTYGRIVYRLPGNEADPQRGALTGQLRAHVKSITFEYGNTFLLTAGLMNLLLILDAFDIAIGRKS